MKIFQKVVFLLYVSLFCIKISDAQQYNFKNLSVKNGLSASLVNHIFQDSRGYIWFATDGGGVNRYDYKTFINYTTKEGLVGNNTTFTTEDKKGNIWIATSDGVSMFNGTKFTNYTFKQGLAKGVVYWIHADKNNTIWFAVNEGGLSKFDGTSFVNYTTKDSLLSNDVYSISEDKAGNLLIGFSNGIMKYDGHHFITLKKNTELSKRIFFSSFTDSKNNIWFGTVYGEVYKYNGDTITQVQLPAEVMNDWIGGITEDNKNNIWLATAHGIARYNGQSFSLYNKKNGLADNEVLSINKDYEGNIWSALQSGASIFQNDPIVNYNEKDGLESNVSCIAKKENNNYLLAVQNYGIKTFANDTVSILKSIPKFKTGSATTLFTDSKQNLWIGTNGSLFKYNTNGKEYTSEKKISEVDSIKLKSVTKIIEDHNGIIWASTYGSGVLKTEKEKITHYDKKSIGSDLIHSIFEDSEGNVWMCTNDIGIIKYANGKYVHYSEEQGLASKEVWDITEDEKQNLYFATSDGLSCFDGKKFKTFTEKDNLCSNHLKCVLWDKSEKCLWTGTNVGINKIKFDADLKIKSVRYYGEDQGLKSLEISGIYEDDKNQLFFYTTDGFVKFKKEEDAEQEILPKIKLTEILVNHDTINWSVYSSKIDSWTKLPEHTTLPHNKNGLQFKFHAFSTRQNQRYQYILEGLDDNWSPVTKTGEASYPTIPPGNDYIFRVRLLTPNGKIVEQTLFTFSISPPWWKTWWFYTLVILFIIIIIYSYINYRTSHLEKEKKILEIKVEERTSELKHTNDKLSVAFTDIKDSINYAKKIQDAILPLDVEIKKALPQSFVLFKPRDIVSGDFYWFNKKEDKVFIAAVDCTGHGVPGAFMSMIGYSLLNEIIVESETLDAANILLKLHHGVRKALKQDRDSFESKDGMDIGLAVIDNRTNTLQYSGAKRPLFYSANGTTEEIKGDKRSIGGLETEREHPFTNNNFELKQGDTFYLFTDGVVDQFGGEKDTKFSTKRLKQTLQELQPMALQEQHTKLETIIEDWKTDTEQTDDILLIGIRF